MIEVEFPDITGLWTGGSEISGINKSRNLSLPWVGDSKHSYYLDSPLVSSQISNIPLAGQRLPDNTTRSLREYGGFIARLQFACVLCVA